MRSAQPVEGGRAMTTVEAAANLQLPGGKVLEITRAAGYSVCNRHADYGLTNYKDLARRGPVFLHTTVRHGPAPGASFFLLFFPTPPNLLGSNVWSYS
jgi:hypothetical protein